VLHSSESEGIEEHEYMSTLKQKPLVALALGLFLATLAAPALADGPTMLIEQVQVRKDTVKVVLLNANSKSHAIGQVVVGVSLEDGQADMARKVSVPPDGRVTVYFDFNDPVLQLTKFWISESSDPM
jgi:hypothetical protein